MQPRNSFVTRFILIDRSISRPPSDFIFTLKRD
jgi:hypothetical protein